MSRGDWVVKFRPESVAQFGWNIQNGICNKNSILLLQKLVVHFATICHNLNILLSQLSMD